MKTRRLVKNAFLLTLPPWALGGCGVIVPPSDNTPPEVTLSVSGLQEKPFTIKSDTTLTMQKGKDLHLYATGADYDGGIRSVRVLGSIDKYCSTEDNGLKYHWHPDANFLLDLSIGVGDLVMARRYVALLVPSSDYYSCPKGSLDYAEGTYQAMAENFHGGKDTSPVLTLQTQ